MAESAEPAQPSADPEPEQPSAADSEAAKSSAESAKSRIKEKAREVIESERVQKSVEYVKTKTAEVMENERVQKSVEYVKDTTKAVTEKVTETTQRMREGASSVWGKGRGQILKVREGVSNMAWRGSAKETLSVKEEQWKDMKNLKAEETTIPARTEHTTVYHVQAGTTLRWTFRVKDYDIGFGVRMRVQEWGGAREDSVLDVERYDCNDTISGSWVADEDRTMVLVFDNRYSKLRSKTVAYIVGADKPPNAEETASAAKTPTPAPVVEQETAAAAEVPAPTPVAEQEATVAPASTGAPLEEPPSIVPSAEQEPSS